jgi:tetratricopeptide (TPR) repeat protein
MRDLDPTFVMEVTRMKRLSATVGLAVCLALFAADTQAQGIARGKVTDEKGQPIPDVKIAGEFQGGVTRKFELTTNKKGEFTQVGLQPGPYKFTASKDGYQPQFIEVRVGIGEPTYVPDFKMIPMAQAAAKAAAADPALNALKGSVEKAIGLAQAGKLDEAEAVYKEAMATNPTVHQIPYNLGGIYYQKKDYANAEAMYKKALEVKPDYVDAMVALSNVYLSSGQTPKAAEVLDKAAADHPQDAKLLFQKGFVDFNTGKSPEAEESFKKAEAIDASNPEIQFYLGSIAVGQGKTDECISRLEKYLSMSPTNASNKATAQGLLAALKKK